MNAQERSAALRSCAFIGPRNGADYERIASIRSCIIILPVFDKCFGKFYYLNSSPFVKEYPL